MSRAGGRVHERVELRAGQDACLPADGAALPEDDQGGDGADVEPLRRGLIAVGVELGDQHLAGAVVRKRVEDRRHDLAGAAPVGIAIQDRKSTRLNSSHLVISYAVFCLKKKKEIYVSYGTAVS